ncbi:MAG: sugar phosphate isomerase/epimerase [Anaerolineae bacterium]|nr:sugar phosphate isomerase/epimerase [Anaerolineae bacterium]
MKVGLYSITYLGIWYDGPALTWREFLRQAKALGYDGVEFDGKRPHANPMDLDAPTRDAIRNEADRLGLEIAALASNNDFSSPVPEQREAQLLMVREQARLARDLGAPIVRLFAAWPGVTLRDGRAHYEEARQGWERAYPDVPRLTRWRLVRDGLREAAAFGEECGVVMALQNHKPVTRHWKDAYDLVQEVGSPWLKLCWDIPVDEWDEAWLRQGAATIGGLTVHHHFGGDFRRTSQGVALESAVPDMHPFFVNLLKQIGYQGYLCYEYCHPAVDEHHDPAGIELVHTQAALALEYMRGLIA